MQNDEPSFSPDDDRFAPDQAPLDAGLAERLSRLVQTERYGVLATQGEGQPYASLVAFAFSDDLASAAFATPIHTRKYDLLTKCDRVALFVDSRSQQVENLMGIEAFTATGRATKLENPTEVDSWASRLIERHPHFETFVRSPTTALFRIDMFRYLHVSRFQEVRQWRPPRG